MAASTTTPGIPSDNFECSLCLNQVAHYNLHAMTIGGDTPLKAIHFTQVDSTAKLIKGHTIAMLPADKNIFRPIFLSNVRFDGTRYSFTDKEGIQRSVKLLDTPYQEKHTFARYYLNGDRVEILDTLNLTETPQLAHYYCADCIKKMVNCPKCRTAISYYTEDKLRLEQSECLARDAIFVLVKKTDRTSNPSPHVLLARQLFSRLNLLFTRPFNEKLPICIGTSLIIFSRSSSLLLNAIYHIAFKSLELLILGCFSHIVCVPRVNSQLPNLRAEHLSFLISIYCSTIFGRGAMHLGSKVYSRIFPVI